MARKTRRCRACRRQFAPRRSWHRHCSDQCRTGFMVPVRGKATAGAVVTYTDGPLRLFAEHHRATNEFGDRERGRELTADPEVLRRRHWQTDAERGDEDEAYRREAVLAYVATPEQQDLLAALAGD